MRHYRAAKPRHRYSTYSAPPTFNSGTVVAMENKVNSFIKEQLKSWIK